ncbi:MAG: hypothetical protein CVU48_07395 [Candidatus Cloacimonetes bacterium HGW-Cloacimonetes-1]|jgi:tetratricopeptide (TPR) repeat protein|nr:MAG: hypothetical protein CVU48_07395 [Candidatus Cloacimonetes bacterium HGW-Cloacimonetes-1]
MFDGGLLRHTFILILLLGIAALGAKTFVRSYSYNASEADSKITARSIALEQVKRLLLEEVGLYISSSIINKDTEINGEVHSFTQTDIQVLSAGITKTKVLAENWNGEVYSLKAEISLDERDVLQQLENLINNSKNLESIENNRNIATNALNELERLKTELEAEKDKTQQLQLQLEYSTQAGILSAREYYEQASDIASTENGDLKQAMELYKKAVAADSTYVDAWVQLGYSYLYTDNAGLARDSFQKAIAMSNGPEALQGMGQSYQEAKDYKTALSYYQKAYDITKKPEDLLRIGEIYYQLREYVKAKELYLSILKNDPSNFTAINHISLIYLSLKEYDQAISCYHQLLQMEADPANMYGSIASAYMEKGDYASAIKFYKSVTELNPGESWNWGYLSRAYANNGDYQNAINAATKQLQLSPNSSWIESFLGDCYLQLNDKANGQKYHLLGAKHGSTSSQKWCDDNNIKWK